MLDFGFYNLDCMIGMKEFPDKFFDLAIVDPPYGGGFTEGGGCQGWFSKYHQNNGEDISKQYSLADKKYWNRFGGWFDRYKPVEDRGNVGGEVRKKNHIVGCSPGTGIFRRTVSHLTKSNNMGRQLLLVTTDKVLCDMEEADNIRTILNGYV